MHSVTTSRLKKSSAGIPVINAVQKDLPSKSVELMRASVIQKTRTAATARGIIRYFVFTLVNYPLESIHHGIMGVAPAIAREDFTTDLRLPYKHIPNRSSPYETAKAETRKSPFVRPSYLIVAPQPQSTTLLSLSASSGETFSPLFAHRESLSEYPNS